MSRYNKPHASLPLSMSIGKFFVGVRRTIINNKIRFGIWHTFSTALRQPRRWIASRSQQHLRESWPKSQADVETDTGLDIDASRSWADVFDIGAVSSPNWKHAVWHATLPESRYRKILDALKINHGDFTFIDFGCGKGKVLLIAASYSYQRIIGVEYIPRLQAIAAKNIAAYQSSKRKCRDVEAVCADATIWPIPPGRCVFFFSNPFDATIMDVVIRRIVESLRENSREAYVVYCAAYHPEVLRKYGFHEKTEWFPAGGGDLLFDVPALEPLASNL
jgi:SAM-dependent methyltransferase